MKKEIVKLDNFGRGITYVDGKICFVDGALSGEIVKIKVVNQTKKYLLADVKDYYRLADDRIDVKCQYNDVCGGCNLNHMSLESENKFKCEKVKEILKKFGNVNDNIIKPITCERGKKYRNKIVVHGDGNSLGFYSKGTNKVVDIEKCLLVPDKVNEVLEVLRQIALTDNIKKAIIRVSNDNSEVMLSLTGEISNYFSLKNVVDVLEINGEVILGDGHIISSIGSKKYYVSSQSFFQINNTLTKKLYDEVLNVVEQVKPKRVLDLYCGTGTIGLYIADKVNEVVGVDYSKSGINDAKDNAKLNESKNCTFICDKVENVIDQFSDFDMVIVDPPRAGLDLKTIEYIKKIGAKNVVYVSCDPVTLGRDLKELSNSYEILEVKPYNMFPRTYHVECVCLLNLKQT